VKVYKDLVKRLVRRVINKAKWKSRAEESVQNRGVWVRKWYRLEGVLFEGNFERSTNLGEGRKSLDWVVPVVQYIALERFLEKTTQATLEKVFEYNEWYKIRRFLDTAIVNKDWVLISKIWDIAATRVFMLRVTKKEGWNMVADIKDPFDEEPMKALFQEKLLSTRQLAKISSKVDTKPEVSVLSFSNLLGGQVSTSIDTKIREAHRINFEIFKE
ncbi:44259_t:CDS:2, partial [Gigaspora margarita]